MGLGMRGTNSICGVGLKGFKPIRKWLVVHIALMPLSCQWAYLAGLCTIVAQMVHSWIPCTCLPELWTLSNRKETFQQAPSWCSCVLRLKYGGVTNSLSIKFWKVTKNTGNSPQYLDVYGTPLSGSLKRGSPFPETLLFLKLLPRSSYFLRTSWLDLSQSLLRISKSASSKALCRGGWKQDKLEEKKRQREVCMLGRVTLSVTAMVWTTRKS